MKKSKKDNKKDKGIDIFKEIEKNLPKEVLDKLPENKEERKSFLLAMSESISFNGPLPPPEYLHGYEQTLPGAADRVISMAEKEQAHRHKEENKIITTSISVSILGLVFGFILVVFFGYITLELGKAGQTKSCIAVGATTAILASIFVLRQWKGNKESRKD